MTTTYTSGALVRTTATFTGVSGSVADPDTITLKYKKGSAATTTVTYPSAPVIKNSTGIYHADLDTSGWTGPGNQVWIVEWIGTGAVQAIASDSWLVQPPAL